MSALSHTTSPSKPHRRHRLSQLDSLRGLACIGVMLHHYTYYYGQEWGHSQPPLFLFEAGRHGVELFFLLSGFVIFMSLQSKSVKDFAILRFWRLFPCYWVTIMVVFVAKRLVPLSPEVAVHGNLSLAELLVNFTMIPTIFSARYVDSAHWTLGFEILFYGLIAAIFVAARAKEKVVVGTLGLWTILSVVWFNAIQRFFDIQVWMTVWWQEDMAHWQHTVSKVLLLPYVHLFLIGISFYFLYQKKHITLAISSIAVAMIADYRLWGWEHTLTVGVCLLIFYGAIFWKIPLLKNKLLIYLGTLSYSLYLIHQTIGFQIIQRIEAIGIHSNVAILIAFLCAITLAHPLHFLIEKPLYRMAKHQLMTKRLTTRLE